MKIKTMLKQKSVFLILAIFILASYLRLFNLSSTPSGFHADEASFYINALSLKTNARDEDNRLLPLSINSLIDPKPALFSYFQVPFITLLNNPTLASRLPSFVLAMLSLWFIYLLTKELVNKKMAVITLFIFSVSPWHIVVSRGTQEVIASFCFLVISIYLLIKLTNHYLDNTTKKLNLKLLVVLFLTSFLSMYFYHSAKIVLPIFSFTYLVYIYLNKVKVEIKRTFLKKSLFLLLLLFIAGIISIFVQESGSRFMAVGFLSDKSPENKLMEQIYTLHKGLSVTTTRVFYNKVTAYSQKLVQEYTNYFSPEFLFFKGGKPFRYKIPDHGLLYLVDIPLLLSGVYLAVGKRKKWSYLFLAFLLLAPIPAMLTTLETPSMIRSFAMIIPINIFISYSLYEVFKVKNITIKWLLIIPITLIYFWQVGYFTAQYHIQAYYDKPWYRNSPYTAIAKEVAQRINQYDEVRVTNDLRPLYTYFVIENLITIKDLQDNPYARNNKEYQLNKFKFNRGVCELGELKKGVLYIAETQCRKRIKNSNLLEVVSTVNYNDETPVYELLQLK